MRAHGIIFFALLVVTSTATNLRTKTEANATTTANATDLKAGVAALLQTRRRVLKATSQVSAKAMGGYMPHAHIPSANYNNGHACAVNSDCKSGRCRWFKCTEDCKMHLDVCSSDSECCGEVPYCHGAISKICHKYPKQDVFSWINTVWNDVTADKGLVFNYRAENPTCVNAVAFQGACGSCWAFAASIAASYRMCRGRHTLSQMDLLCELQGDKPEGICSGGFADRGLNFIANTGIVEEKNFPYSAFPDKSMCSGSPSGQRFKLEPGKHYYDRCAENRGAPGCPAFGAVDYPFRTMKGREPYFNEKVQYELRNYGPVTVSLELHNDWDFQTSDPACMALGGGTPMSRVHSKSCCWNNRGGIFTNKQDRGWCDETAKNSDGSTAGHAMIIVGWGSYGGIDFWHVQNSHGLLAHGGGMMRIAMDYLNEDDDDDAFTVDTSMPIDWTPGQGSEGADCWYDCGGNGKCKTDFCGKGGLCCSQKAGFDGKGVCPKGMGGKTKHTCVSSCVDEEPGDAGFPWKWSCAAYGVVPGSSKKDGGKGSYCDSHSAFREHCPRSCGTCNPVGCRDGKPGEPGFPTTGGLGEKGCRAFVDPGCSVGKKGCGNCDNTEIRKHCPLSCGMCSYKDAKW